MIIFFAGGHTRVELTPVFLRAREQGRSVGFLFSFLDVMSCPQQKTRLLEMKNDYLLRRTVLSR